MHRRTVLGGSLAAAGLLTSTKVAWAAQANPSASPGPDDALPLLELALTDTGFELAEPLAAGRHRVVVSNAGASTISHFALGKIPDAVTDAEYEAWLASEEGDTEALSFDDIAFVGVPDWPQPGRPVSGVVDLAPGRYLLVDPISGREPRRLVVDGEPPAAPEPASDLTVTLREMTIDLPDAALTTAPVRWKIENHGGMGHDVALVPVSPDFTEESFQTLLALPEEATPPAGTPGLDYQPAAAIGILAKGHTSWLDVELTPGRYLAVCMLPLGTGYPHAMDGMYRVLDIR